MTKINILVVDNDNAYRESLAKDVLELEGYQVFQAGSPEDAKEILKDELIHLAILDIRLEDDDNPNDRSGLKLNQELDPDIARIILTGYPPEWLKPGVALGKVLIPLADRSLKVYLVQKKGGPEAILEAIRRTLGEKIEVIHRCRIAVLTSGGDSPGMNTAIRAIVRVAMDNGMEVIGVQDGYKGLVNNLMRRLAWNEVSDILGQGGTILGTARFKKFEDPKIREKAVDNIIAKHITGLIVIGGDGSMKGAQALAKDLSNKDKKLHTIAIPGTIDNDLWGTDMSLGAASAANAMIEEMRNMIRPAQALRRIFVCEMMGRYCGYLALQAALGIGADAVIIPEKVVEIDPPRENEDSLPWEERINDIDTIIHSLDKVKEIAHLLELTFTSGKRYGFVVLSEGVKLLTHKTLNIEAIQKILEGVAKRWDLKDPPDVRTHVLGYPVRGVPPCRYDLWLGARLGAAAVKCLLDGKTDTMVGWSEDDGEVIETTFDEVLTKSNRPPNEIWADRPRWQEMLALQEALACPPALREQLKDNANPFVKNGPTKK